ncbi:alpha-N-acetylgalactosaminide alpha-2,6-sialyltransferase 1-like [Aplochiton taeniatus]
MNRGDVDVKEWNRLSHFNNPFGFMEYNYTEIKEVLDLIPKPARPLLTPRPESRGCIRCAVVATGGILNGSRMGKEIDQHDYVFRMNGAIIKGHEEDVGNRTSVYVHSAHSLTTSLIIFNKYGYKHIPNDEGIKYVMIPEGERDYQWLHGLFKKEKVSVGPYKGTEAWKFYAGQYNETSFYVLHPDFLRYVRNRFLKSWRLSDESWDIVRPSNGAFTLFLALHTCDEVTGYGFLTEDHDKYHNYYFEKNKRTKVIFYQNHDFALEMKIWKKLHDSKMFRLYQRTEETGKDNPPKM